MPVADPCLSGHLLGAPLPDRQMIGKGWMGSLAGAAHLLKYNAGVLRRAPRGQKPRVDYKGKSLLEQRLLSKRGPRNRGLAILTAVRSSRVRCQKSYQRDNWLVATKRP
jgi:hypothetical protein